MGAKPTTGTVTREDRDLVEAAAFSRKGRVDTTAGLVEDVGILPIGKGINGNDYTESAVREAATTGIYEGAKVNLNHAGDGKGGSRLVQDRFGKIEGARFVEGYGLRGNLRFNPKGDAGERFSWFAEHMPDALGMSHNAVGRGQKLADRFLVEKLVKVHHVDVVADPSTTKGLFESQGTAAEGGADPAQDDRPVKEDDVSLKEATIEKLRAERPDLVKTLTEAALQEAAAGDDAKKKDSEMKKLREEVDGFKAKEAVAAKRAQVDKILGESKLPKEAISETFTGQLLEAKDEQAMKALIDDRRRLVMGERGRPKSREQGLNEAVGLGTMPTSDFLKKVTK